MSRSPRAGKPPGSQRPAAGGRKSEARSPQPGVPVLTGQELEIMKIVWDREQATVRDVYETLLAQRHIAYTTVMTVMRILERKGHLRVSRADRAYLYRPTRPRQRVLGEMVREFVDRVFGGSAEPLVQHLVADRHLTDDDLRQIATYLKPKKPGGEE
jgi:BlaI family penicillinase repressor